MSKKDAAPTFETKLGAGGETHQAVPAKGAHDEAAALILAASTSQENKLPVSLAPRHARA